MKIFFLSATLVKEERRKEIYSETQKKKRRECKLKKRVDQGEVQKEVEEEEGVCVRSEGG